MLSEGIRKNSERLKQKNINLSTDKMDEVCKALEEIAAKQEVAENSLKEVRTQAHSILDELKEIYNENKMPIKVNFSLEQWADFGLMDKR